MDNFFNDINIKAMFDSKSEFEEYKMNCKKREIERLEKEIIKLEIIIDYLKDELYHTEKMLNDEKFFDSDELDKRAKKEYAITLKFLKRRVYSNEYRLEYYNKELQQLKE